jgi:hypothetical protein
LAHLSGGDKPQKARQGWQQFSHEKYKDVIAPVIAKRWEERKAKGEIPANARQDAKFRGEITRELYNALSQEERDQYMERAAAEAQAERERVERIKKEGPSSRPEDRQLYVARRRSIV